MDLILLLVLICLILVFFVAKKIRMTEKQRLRKQLVRELRRSGQLKNESDALFLKLNAKNRELRASKDRSVNLMKQFVELQGLNERSKHE